MNEFIAQDDVHLNSPYIGHSKQIADRLQSRSMRRKISAIMYVIFTVMYLVWRATIINENSLTLSLIYYAAECLGLILGLTTICTGWNYHYRKPIQAPDGLCVDILVPVYREPLDVIRRTLIAAKNIDYPHQTLVLDDGRRPEIKELAAALGLQYLSRHNNAGAKAGNLNFGLQHSTADYIAVFDADHIAQPHALHAMLGYFNDPDVAMVQSPQDYYNIDAFQYMNPRDYAGIWHDQSWFYNVAQACKDGDNGASCVGTGVVYRREALNAIDGIPTDTITEDIHTSLKLHKQGYKVVYLNESIAYGIAAADLDEYYKTRLRWAHGNLEALKIERVLTCKGLTLKQRFAYFSLGLIYLEGWQQVLLFVVPLLSLGFGLAPFDITVKNILIVLSFPILTTLLLQEFGAGLSRYWTNEIFAMARWPVHIAASFALFGKKLAWKTSTKNIQGRINWHLMSPQILLLLLNFIALAVAIWQLQGDYASGPLGQFVTSVFTVDMGALAAAAWSAPMPDGYSIDLVIVAGFWALFNVSRVVFFITKAVENAQHSHPFYRFALPFPVEFPEHPGELATTENISEDWVRLKLASTDGRLGAHPEITLRLMLPAGPLDARLIVTRSGANWLEGRFDWRSDAALDKLAAALYSIDWHREFQTRQAFFLTPIDFALRLLGINAGKKQPAATKWQPLLIKTSVDAPAEYALGVVLTDGPDSGALISFTSLILGQLYVISSIEMQRASINSFRVVNEEPVSTPPHAGLDGHRHRRYSVTWIKKEL